MKIWCFLCCGEDNKEREGDMDRGKFSGKIELEYLDDLELGFYLGLPGSSDGGGSKRDLGGSVVEREGEGFEGLGLSIGGSSSSNGSRYFEQFTPSSSGKGNVICRLELGESSAAAENEKLDGDLQNKRVKFDVSSFRECHFTITGSSIFESNSRHGSGNFDDSQDPSSLLGDEMLSLPSISMDGYNLDPISPDSGKIDGGGIEEMGVQMDLSDDLLHMVFSFLGHIDLCRAAMVCKQWRTAGAHEDFWRSLNFENRNISVSQFEDICHRYPRATEVNFSGTPAIHLLVMRAVSLLRNLEALTLGRGQLGDTFFHALSDCEMLKSLIVNDATLGNSVQEISINHDRLQHLQITKCRVLRIFVRCPQLETLSLKRSNMAHAVLNCPLLHDLDIGSCHKLPDAAIRSAVTSCPLLESLDMSNCSCVSDETLREIAIVCASLHLLNASYCPNISLESVRLPMLTVLKLDSCEGITSGSMAAISHSYMLEDLELDNCSLLTSVSLDLPCLRNISLVHCRKFVDLSLQCLLLSSVSVWNSAALHRINITSNALKKLVLQKQESLTTLTLQCQHLQEVDLSDCESLTNSVCEVFSDGGGCPKLKSLVLDNCENLTAVRLSSTSLVSLSLAGCRTVTSLELTCPYLEQIHLDGCDHLESASFCPVGLQSLNLGICPKLSALHIEAPSMVLLELKGCGVLSEASIDCPLLTSLDASFCSRLKDDCLSATTISCPLIESLILMSCPSIGPDGLFSLHWLQSLTYLDLSYTFLIDLQPVFQSCMQLKILKLQACKYLNNSSLEALYKQHALPDLCELDLSYGTLCQSAIEELLACCIHLTHVSLNGCVNMHDLNWGFTGSQLSELRRVSCSSNMDMNETIQLPHHLLQNLNCVGCPNIKKVFIPPRAHCEHLVSLNLSLSVNLKEVDVTCYNLCFLNLSNCCSLEILKLECPRLTSLFLQQKIISSFQQGWGGMFFWTKESKLGEPGF
ncbi:F-box/LRR-repeat protein 15 [Ancistrocladus abbreviatus]